MTEISKLTFSNAAKILEEQRAFEKKHKRLPTDDELSKALGISVQKIQKAKEILEIPEDEEHEQMDVNYIDTKTKTPFESAAQKNLRTIMTQILSELDPKEEDVLRQRFGMSINKTSAVEETGEHFGVTRERIRQIEQRALNKSKQPTRVRKLRDFLKDDD
ncbi:MAG: hypothetical protein IJQ55_00740 [Alphaproteobacteria bacterium]|nr:hypothetical protein [Alphaproteobacteria bacterium]